MPGPFFNPYEHPGTERIAQAARICAASDNERLRINQNAIQQHLLLASELAASLIKLQWREIQGPTEGFLRSFVSKLMSLRIELLSQFLVPYPQPEAPPTPPPGKDTKSS